MEKNTNHNGKTLNKHKWRFFRSGGFDQVRLDTGADIASLDQLDQKLWAALSCPVKGIEFDSKTLEIVDVDKDGRIRAPEILAAVQWTTSLLKNPDELVSRNTSLPLAAINDSHPEGEKLLASAKQILKNLGKSDATEITVSDTADTTKIFANTQFNGDAIVTADSTADETIRQVINEIIETLEPVTDRSGKPGVDKTKLDDFFKQATDYTEWWNKGRDQADETLPFADKTEESAVIFEKVKAKVDDYFTRCRFAKFDARSTAHLNRSEDEYKALAAKDFSDAVDDIATFPLAQVEVDKPLPLNDEINPAWQSIIFELRDKIVQPLFGNAEKMTLAQWQSITEKFSAYEKWKNSKPATKIEKLGYERIKTILDNKFTDDIAALIEQDKQLENEANNIATVDKLVTLYCHLHQILNNFVNFSDFYTRKGKAIFQVGTLYLDGRSCELCTSVQDMAKHSTLASLSKIYLAYCECTRKNSSEKMTIVAGFTGGDSDNLMVGRNGVFYDRKGNDWDATIVKIVDNPISIRQAFWAPYKRIARMIGEQIEKMAAARDKAAQDKAAAGISAAGEKVESGKATPPAPFDVAKFAGIFAAIGLAIGAIGTAIAAVFSSFLSLAWWQMPLALIGVVFGVSIPSMIIAALKLRQRNLAPLLDASGWSVNTQAKINIPFGAELTGVAKIPEGSVRSANDPYAEKKRPWKTYTFLVLLLIATAGLWYKGYLQQWINDYGPKLGLNITQKTEAPTAPTPTAQPEEASVPKEVK